MVENTKTETVQSTSDCQKTTDSSSLAVSELYQAYDYDLSNNSATMATC